jgi:predicted phosphodiesterase
MKLHILSDLHTEFADFVPPETDADTIILAGDIGVGVEGVRWAARYYPDRPVIYVPGNHEFYGHDIGVTAELKAIAPENMTVLSDDTPFWTVSASLAARFGPTSNCTGKAKPGLRASAPGNA